jgi:hypothetical protein
MILGEVIQNCWRKRYSSIVQLEYTITADLCTGLKIAPVMDNRELELRLKRVPGILAEERKYRFVVTRYNPQMVMQSRK